MQEKDKWSFPGDGDVEPRTVGRDHTVLPRPGDPGDGGVGSLLSCSATAHRPNAGS